MSTPFIEIEIRIDNPDDPGLHWEDIKPFTIKLPEDSVNEQADKLALYVSEITEYDVRWNIKGCHQGHYFDPDGKVSP